MASRYRPTEAEAEFAAMMQLVPEESTDRLRLFFFALADAASPLAKQHTDSATGELRTLTHQQISAATGLSTAQLQSRLPRLAVEPICLIKRHGSRATRVQLRRLTESELNELLSLRRLLEEQAVIECCRVEADVDRTARQRRLTLALDRLDEKVEAMKELFPITDAERRTYESLKPAIQSESLPYYRMKAIEDAWDAEVAFHLELFRLADQEISASVYRALCDRLRVLGLSRGLLRRHLDESRQENRQLLEQVTVATPVAQTACAANARHYERLQATLASRDEYANSTAEQSVWP